MIKSLEKSDIPQVAEIHKTELTGFLPELGEDFLQAFYRVSLDIPEMATFVATGNDQILGFVTIITSAKGLYKKVLQRNILLFIWLFLRYIITHPLQIVKTIKILSYPGFGNNSPELLTIAIKSDAQGKGIGRKLFTKAAEEFKKMGIKRFKISIYDKLPANGFYKKMGCEFERQFEFLGEKMNYYVYKSK